MLVESIAQDKRSDIAPASGGGVFGSLPFVPLTVKASYSSYRIEAASHYLGNDGFGLHLAGTHTHLSYFDDGSDLLNGSPWDGHSCSGDLPWWQTTRCSDSHDLDASDDFIEAITDGDFGIIGTSSWDHYQDSIAFAYPGSWGHGCSWDPGSLPPLPEPIGLTAKTSCDGNRYFIY